MPQKLETAFGSKGKTKPFEKILKEYHIIQNFFQTRL